MDHTQDCMFIEYYLDMEDFLEGPFSAKCNFMIYFCMLCCVLNGGGGGGGLNGI